MTTSIARNRYRHTKTRRWPLVMALAAALAIGWWLLARSPEPERHTPAAVRVPSSLGSVDPEPAATGERPARASAAIETTRVFASKDPFEPLVDIGATGSTTDDTGGKISTGDQTSKADEKQTSTNEVSADGQGTSVSLVHISGSSTASVEIEGQVLRVTRGERFADSFKLLYIDGKCASMLYGDDQFSLCEGENVSK